MKPSSPVTSLWLKVKGGTHKHEGTQHHEREYVLESSSVLADIVPKSAGLCGCHYRGDCEAGSPTGGSHCLHSEGQGTPAEPPARSASEPDAAFKGAQNAQPCTPPDHEVRHYPPWYGVGAAKEVCAQSFISLLG